jgi:hypothetical protein
VEQALACNGCFSTRHVNEKGGDRKIAAFLFELYDDYHARLAPNWT